MILAVNTHTSSAGLWAIVAVAVACLAFWLIMVVGWASRPEARGRVPRTRPPARMRGGQDTAAPLGPVMGGTHVAEGGRSLAPRRDAPAMAMAGAWGGADREPEAAEPGTAARGGEEPAVTRDDMPKVPRPRSPAPFGMTTSAGYPAGTTPRTPRDMPDTGVQWTQGTAGPSVPAQRESPTDQPVRSRRGDRDRDEDRDRES
jgi:hypothetical protein